MTQIERSWEMVTAPDKPGGNGHGMEACGDKQLFVSNSIIDVSATPIAEIDEAIGITQGATAYFNNCVIRGAAKLILCGCGDPADKPYVQAEKGKRVTFKNCILIDFCRRGPEVQDGMIVEMEDCAIFNWGSPDHFCDGGLLGWLKLPWGDEHKWQRGFGCWAHDGGTIIARRCVFKNTVKPPMWQRLVSRISHFGQAIDDYGFLRGIFHRDAYLSGYLRGLTAGNGGTVKAINCYAEGNIVLDNHTDPLSHEEATKIVDRLNRMWAGLVDHFNRGQL